MTQGVSIEKLSKFVEDAIGVPLDEVGEIHIAQSVVTLVTAPSLLTGTQEAIRFPLVNEPQPEPENGPKPGPGLHEAT